MAPLQVIVSPHPIEGTAADDHEISRSLLRQVAGGQLAGALRIWAPVPALALTRLDELRPGADAARVAAERAGLSTVTRLSGGHAVVLGPGSLCVGVAEPAATYRGIHERYQRYGSAIAGALTDLAIAVEQGALEREWCPGAWSFSSGPVKLAGLAQRAVKGAAWLEAVIELAPDPVARRLLAVVYDALGLSLDVRTFGSLSEVAGAPIAFDDLAGRLAARLLPD